LRAASAFHAVFIRVRCAPALPATRISFEEDPDCPGALNLFAITLITGAITFDPIDTAGAAGGLQSITVEGVPVNMVINIPAFTPGTINPVTVTYVVVDEKLPSGARIRICDPFWCLNGGINRGELIVTP
jgi:hypothetical protein